MPKPPTEPRYLSSLTQVTLTDGTTTLILKNAQLGDKEQLGFFQTFNRNRRNQIRKRDKNYTADGRVKLSFTHIDVVTAKTLLTFMKTNLGKNVTLIDHNDVSWTVFIIDADAPISEHNAIDVDCRSFQFELTFLGDTPQ